MNHGVVLSETSNLSVRHQWGKFFQGLFLFATVIGLIVLGILIITVVDKTFTLVAVTNKVDPATLADRPLEELSAEELRQILRDKLRPARLRTIERDLGPIAQMGEADLTALIMAEIVKPTTRASYPLFQSLTRRAEIEAEIRKEYPDAQIYFKAWLSWDFLQRSMATNPDLAGVRQAIKGSLLIILITILFAFPIGVGAAIYLEEYADKRNRINRILQTNIENLAGVPSIIYGILGLAVFVRALAPITSGAAFGMDAGSGRTILSGGLTMALLVLPILIISSQEALRAVPNSLREASFAMGATRWQTIWHHVLPYALPGILTGTILAVSRALGETAPLILVGASSLINKDPQSVFSFFTALPFQIYNWTVRPQPEFRNIAAAAILVLLAVLLSLNTTAIVLRNRLSKRL
ncbi:phosphate ABC transporter permease PstA [Anaerolinea sp.]|uniref:phosphate ABC transporter permease PstA n=1 Tax=Anaerolinea sp. TaxID=1872519 RepID=UPI002ACEDE43|nr:phosphate ABC transporter permease PstA [Anaerolinea sp.]